MTLRRREFITLLGGAAAAWPLVVRAQQQALPTVGLLFAGAAEENGDQVTALLRGLSETGFVEGRNVAIEYRWTSDPRRNRELAADLVNRHAAVIAANVAGKALSAKALTTTIQLTALTLRHAVPTIFFSRRFAEVGGLMSYSVNRADLFRQAGIYVGLSSRARNPRICRSCNRPSWSS